MSFYGWLIEKIGFPFEDIPPVAPEDPAILRPPEPDILFLLEIIISFYIWEVLGAPAFVLKLLICNCYVG